MATLAPKPRQSVSTSRRFPKTTSPFPLPTHSFFDLPLRLQSPAIVDRAAAENSRSFMPYERCGLAVFYTFHWTHHCEFAPTAILQDEGLQFATGETRFERDAAVALDCGMQP